MGTGPYYDRASAALDAAHKACFRHPDRGPIGMSHGPFSGVNEALGIIAELEGTLLPALRQRIEELERAQPELIAIAIMQGQQGSDAALTEAKAEIARLREGLAGIRSEAMNGHHDYGVRLFDIANRVDALFRSLFNGGGK